ncbi:hypothetical protein INS49_013307 [Diaporthe citri]|uniref:uncharacterized protein n=1 Tax=Diaporthe citri TaxID=83186 RepID=UPI001C820583|nr:uncharacterized protein INS49_013307 [Diaporthe citri]KAG6357430.1 hypothetical protein INS49_013307 [Diaporthe citri]
MCGASVTLLSASPASDAGNATQKVVESFFKSIGCTIFIAESQMEVASVICHGSPAFMALFCDAIVDGAVAGGLPRPQAEAMAALAVPSFLNLLRKGKGWKRPSEVRETICAYPGPTTIGAILDLEKGGIRGSISGAVRDAMLAARLTEKDGG